MSIIIIFHLNCHAYVQSLLQYNLHCYLAYFEGDYRVLECQKYNTCAGMLQMYPWRMKRMCCLSTVQVLFYYTKLSTAH